MRMTDPSGPKMAFAAILAASLFPCLVALARDRQETEKWHTYEGCTLMTNHFLDGDSFHVKAGRRQRIFRLYFVDAPEVEAQFPDRVRSQADYFGVGTDTVLRIGEKARRFTLAFLSKPFSVCTRYEDARGQSELPRFYALIRTRQGDLGEALVRNGLARVYGKGTTLPDGTKARAHFRRLRSIQNEARADRLGGWAYGAKPAEDERRTEVQNR